MVFVNRYQVSCAVCSARQILALILDVGLSCGVYVRQNFALESLFASFNCKLKNSFHTKESNCSNLKRFIYLRDICKSRNFTGYSKVLYRSLKMDGARRVWVPDPVEGYKMGVIKDISSNMVTVEMKGTQGTKELVAPYSQTFPCEEYEKDVDDNCSLMYLNDATLLNNLRMRYDRDSIYTYVANILIAINPYKRLDHLYNKPSIESYQGKSLGTRPPHVFAIADKAYRDMKHLKESQSIIVSGESGAGKTESTKYILKYLTESWGSGAGPIEQRIVESNPLLEAFGNAKTMRNNNSSRFGKFVEIHFDSKNQVCGAYISHYLLEKSRICLQSPGERNYHIFYRLCAGAPDKLRATLKIESPDQFHYLRGGCTQYFCNKENEARISAVQRSAVMEKHGVLRDITLDDVSDFDLTDSAMSHMGLSEKIKLEIYRVIAGVLHLGNVSFEDPPPNDTTGGCRISESSNASLEVTAILLGCDKEQLSNSLVTRTMRTTCGGRRGSDILVPLKTMEAQNARDALAKAVYSRLFDFVVLAVNKSLPFSESNSYIGLLDIAGFEYFQTNSFEQFCINYCNEKLQQFFNERILKEEQALYEKEDLKVKKIHYVDNQDCIDLIESRPTGVFNILDEESKLPKPSPEHFAAEVHRMNRDHPRLNIPRKSKLKAHREIRDDEGFLIRHFAGAVCYESAQFVEKNNDALHYSLESLVLFSKSGFLKSLFEAPTDSPLVASSSSSSLSSSTSSSGKLGFVSVGSKFQSQLVLLMEKLRSTGTNFIRCIKPNSKMEPRCFEGTQILTQLQCSGMPSVLDLMHQGFPSRTPFSELYEMYKRFMPPNMARLDPRLFCKALFKALGLNEYDYKFGMTKVFFRPGKFAEFDQLIKSDPEHLAQLIKKVQKWLLRMRWKKAQWSALSAIRAKNIMEYRRKIFVIIQSRTRSWKVRKEYLPRIKCMTKIRSLYVQLEPMKKMAQQLKEGQVVATEKVDSLARQMEDIMRKLQTSEGLGPSEIDAIHETLMSCMDGTLGQLRRMVEQEREAAERERLRLMQEKLEEERRLQEEEDKKRRDDERRREEEEREKKRLEEEEKQMRAEMEARRLMEEKAERMKKEDEARKFDEARVIREQEAIERAIKEQQLEQDRRDRELALRLAAEDANLVEDPQRYDYSLPKKQNTIQKKPGQRFLPLPAPSFNLFGSSQRKDTSQMLMNAATNQRKLEPSPNPLYNNDVISSFDPLAGGAEMMRSASSTSLSPTNIDLTTWKYADLRDVINTSCDVDMLERCREEVHRRLMVYHEWRVKNKVNKDDERAPQSIMDIAQNPHVLEQFSTPSPLREQRFFRIPFKRAFDPSRPDLISSGWWLAHFDGNWVARQMELHQGRPPVLLVAGADDMKLCELSLPQTGLTKKEGAEILEREFEDVWTKNGGNEYLIMVAGKATSRYLRLKMGLSG